ncbi:MAG: hypothetical protein WA771_13240 [Chthoniobacterales bacterium]
MNSTPVIPGQKTIKKIFLGALLSTAAVFFVIPNSASAATAPVFGDLRGTYRGIERIVVKKQGTPKRFSAPVKTTIRLSRGKKALQIEVEGSFIRNNKRGKITSNYSIAGKGRAVLRLRDQLNNENLKATGTGNLRRRGGRFTMLGRGYGLDGVVTGKIRSRGNSLRILQTLRDGTETVTFRILLSRRAKK